VANQDRYEVEGCQSDPDPAGFGHRGHALPDNNLKQALPDGTVLILSGLKVGRTNTYTHGTLLSRTLGRFAPSKGLTLAGFTAAASFPDHTYRNGGIGNSVRSTPSAGRFAASQFTCFAAVPTKVPSADFRG